MYIGIYLGTYYCFLYIFIFDLFAAKATHTLQPNPTQNPLALSISSLESRIDSPLLLGDDEDVVEEEEIDLLPRRPLEEDAVVFHKRSHLSSLDHPPGG